MSERLKFLNPVRNVSAALAISFLPTAASDFEVNYSDSTVDGNIELVQSDEDQEELSLLEQVDDLVESDWGKALSYSFLTFSILNSAYRLQKGLELDTKKQFGFNIISSASAIALASSIAAQTEIDMDPNVSATLLTAFSVANAAYTASKILETDRSLSKRISGIGASCAFLATSAVIVVNTIDKT